MTQSQSQAVEEDLLNRPINADVTFKFASIPLPEEVRVCTLPILTAGKGSMGYFDEFGPRQKTTVDSDDLDSCYFSLNTELMPDGPQPTHVLPKGFYCNEFLNLDPFDIPELLAFQRKYGRVVGARTRIPYETGARAAIRPEPDGDIFAGIRGERHADQLSGICASQRLFDAVPDDEFVEAHLIFQLSAVSFREAIATVLDAQGVVRSLLRVQQETSNPMTTLEVLRAKDAAEYLSIILGKTVPSIRLIAGSPKGERFYDLIDGIFIQLARGLLNNNVYRICANPECGRMFTPREMNRRLDTKYCCSACQERAKHLRYVNRHSKS